MRELVYTSDDSRGFGKYKLIIDNDKLYLTSGDYPTDTSHALKFYINDIECFDKNSYYSLKDDMEAWKKYTQECVK